MMGTRRLFELTNRSGSSFSPYVWRAKFALARKGIAYESVPVGFTEIGGIGAGTFRTVPILRDDDHWVQGSWEIADHLDREYPEQPLFLTAQERALARFFDQWLAGDVIANLFRICVFDIYVALREADQAYFREGREKRLGQSLEAAHDARHAFLPVLHQRLQPLRRHLRDQSFVGGDEPDYADYTAASALIWGGSVATTPLLPDDDTLLPWLRRCLDLHGGVGAALVLQGLPALPPSAVSR
jgi:glutathione S-transferase